MLVETDTSLYSAYNRITAEKANRCNPFSNMPGYEEEKESETIRQTKRMRAMLRELMNSPDSELKSGAAAYGGKNAFDELIGTEDDKEEKEIQKVSRYNYKEVANKILKAKTSLSAAQAVIAARRKIVEVKRKISEGDGDPEELQLALTHARRMEMAARKKKHNLELEELVEHTRRRDENSDKTEEAVSDMKEAVAEISEGEVTEQEDAVFQERQDMIEEASEAMRQRDTEASDRMLADMNAMIGEYGEELLEELEKQMEQLENMEIVDPNMSEEELAKLKQKHRAAESKAIVKADMDYLKGMIKHMQDTGNALRQPSGSGAGFGMVSPGLIFSAATDPGLDAAMTAEGAAPAFDIAL